MPTQTTCPSCHRPLRVPDNLVGQNVKCPGCQTVFRVEGESAPPPLPAPADDAIREQPPATEPTPETYREQAGERAAPPLLPPPPEDGGLEDEDELERNEERVYERRRLRREQRARERVAGPANALMVTGGLSIAASLLNVLRIALGGAQMAGGGGPPMAGGGGGPFGGGPNQGVFLIGVGVVSLIIGVFMGGMIIHGASKMKKLESYGLVITAIIFAMLPCNGCCIIGLPFGIWALIVLNDPDVKSSFH